VSDSLEASMMKRIGELKAEVASLEANCKRMSEDYVKLADDHARLKDENKILTMLVEKMQRDFYESMTDEEKAIYEANKQKFTNLFYNAIKRKMN